MNIEQMKSLIKIFEELGLIDLIAGAEHDTVYIGIDSEAVDPNSDLAQKLDEIGCYYDDDVDCWYIHC